MGSMHEYIQNLISQALKAHHMILTYTVQGRSAGKGVRKPCNKIQLEHYIVVFVLFHPNRKLC